jgi:hypothetical protein
MGIEPTGNESIYNIQKPRADADSKYRYRQIGLRVSPFDAPALSTHHSAGILDRDAYLYVTGNYSEAWTHVSANLRIRPIDSSNAGIAA